MKDIYRAVKAIFEIPEKRENDGNDFNKTYQNGGSQKTDSTTQVDAISKKK